MAKIFRPGATGALLDEYEQVIAALKEVISTIPDTALTTVIDTETTDENCRSVQAILTHVVSAGFGYATSIHNLKGPQIVRREKVWHVTVDAYLKDLADLFLFTEEVFRGIKDDELEQYDASRKIRTGWGQLYDIEQMTEHAIVHILRHRRQIEKIKLYQLSIEA